MKAFFLLGFYMCFSIFTLSPQKISGIYTNEAGIQIKIEGNTFIYIIPQSHSPIYTNDTIAKCTFNIIDDQFIEINSIDDYSSILKSMRFIQNKIDKINDSILIKFIIPYNRTKLKIKVYDDYPKLYELEYSERKQAISISNKSKQIAFYIRPESLLDVDFDGQYFGRVSFTSLEYVIDKNVNYIEIEIPAIDNSFFEKYYIKGEYVRIVNDTIIWKGEVFTKVK
jgi:hypothetical protein